ncbi:MAG: nucleotidyltransferase domain-containing protein [Propionivibrio sp.]|nr:nucleotidyltransferase domain-containing protein [Propionivibrio sp.]
MRLSNHQAAEIVKLARQITQRPAVVRVFGSRLDDHAKGGDLDLLIELDEPVANPALLSAQLSAKVSRLINGRKVDVLLTAPNLLRLPIHDIAISEGQPL